jgi:hypothetical protein
MKVKVKVQAIAGSMFNPHPRRHKAQWSSVVRYREDSAYPPVPKTLLLYDKLLCLAPLLQNTDFSA